MLPDIEKLLELQVADQEIRKLQEEIAELPKRMAAIEQKLAGTKAQLEKARAAAKADEANKKKFESTIQDLQAQTLPFSPVVAPQNHPVSLFQPSREIGNEGAEFAVVGIQGTPLNGKIEIRRLSQKILGNLPDSDGPSSG